MCSVGPLDSVECYQSNSPTTIGQAGNSLVGLHEREQTRNMSTSEQPVAAMNQSFFYG